MWFYYARFRGLGGFAQVIYHSHLGLEIIKHDFMSPHVADALAARLNMTGKGARNPEGGLHA